MKVWLKKLNAQGVYILILGAIVVIGMTGAVIYNAVNALVESEARVDKTKSVIRELTDTYSDFQRTELRFRTFLITGDKSDLPPRLLVAEKDQPRWFDLHTVKANTTNPLSKISQLERFISDRLTYMLRVIYSDTLEQANRTLRQDLLQSNDSLDLIRQLIFEIEDLEYDRLQIHAASARQARKEVFAATTVVTSIALITLVALFLLVYRADKKAEEETQTLEKLVEQRTSELQHLLNELQRSNQDLQDFAFVASHDLQEPLRKISTFSDRLMEKYADSLGDGRDYLNRLHSAAKRMSKLIEDLLEFSRISTHAQQCLPIDMREVIDEVLEVLEVSISESNATITLTELPTIEADSMQMKQLFQNLIGNALKFSPNDQPPLVVISSMEIEAVEHPIITDQAWYEITIEDNGIGFDEKYLEKIFTPFQRLNSKAAYAGTGIGLAVCKKIIDRHGGEITAISELGLGSTFKIRLPATQAMDSELNFHLIHEIT